MTGWLSLTAWAAVAACSSLGGSHARPDPAAAPPAPPRGAELAYRFELSSPPGLVEVQIVCLGAATGTTTLLLSEHWDGLRAIGREVRGLRAWGAGGRTLEVEHPRSHLWSVRHAPGERLRVVYRLVSPARELNLESPVHHHHLPIVGRERFHLIGNLGLLIPEHLWASEPIGIHVEWKGFGRAGWTVVSSHSVSQGGFLVHMNLEEFRHALFAAGRLRLIRRLVRGGEVVVSIQGEKWAFDAKDFADMAVRVVECERAFFDDHSDPFFLINLIPVGRAQAGLRAMSGTGLTGSFALFMAPGLRLQEREAALMVLHLLAHELFHHWNGATIVVDQPELLHYWFSEGFTNHYTRKLLLRGGLIDEEEFLRNLNETLARYTFSPVRDAPNRRILEGFWRDPDLHDLPYLRGDVVALLVDHRIRTRSKGRRSLDDLMRALLLRARRERRAVDNRELFELIAEYTSAGFAARVREIIVDGEPVQLSPGSYAPCMRLVTEQLGPFDLGFDFAGSRIQRRVQGVRRGSRAFRAGLRDGQKLMGWSVASGKFFQEVELVVRGRGGVKTITYLPQGAPRPVPQFRLDRWVPGCRMLVKAEKDCMEQAHGIPWRH